MLFNQNRDITATNNQLLKQVNEFNYLESNIASTEKDIDVRIAKRTISE